MIKTVLRNAGVQLVCLAGLFVIPAMIVSGPAQAGRIKHPVAVFSGLDKITGRTIAFEAAAGETVQFGTLQITERACYTRPATETPQTTSFVEVDEIDAATKSKRIFSGWMFAASPGLHGIEHPIYDIWLTDCTGSFDPPEVGPAPDDTELPPPDMPDSPQSPAEEPAGRPHRGHPGGKQAAPAATEPADEPPSDQPDAESPPVDAPIEVGPPPGLGPAPQGKRRPPVPQN